MENNTEKEKRKILREKFGVAFILFGIITILVFFIFPKELLGNIYVLIPYFIGCLYFIYRFYSFKSKLK
jgi:xanthine/uracil permease